MTRHDWHNYLSAGLRVIDKSGHSEVHEPTQYDEGFTEVIRSDQWNIL